MARVVLEQVSKLYPGVERPAVDRVDIEARDREFLVLVGPSGCGKSTTLRLIAGLEDATSGEIRIGDRRVNETPPKDRDIAMIFQNYALYPHMTVYQNLAFPLKMRRFPKAEIDARVREAARMLDIEEFLDRKPRALSGGQRQRVAVGRAIVRRPSVFLFDEPLSNLDAKMRVVMRAEISRLHRRLEATVVYVTHDQVEAMTMGDRIVVMNRAKVQQIDAPRAIYDRPRNMFVAGFVGSPPMNFLRGRLVEAGATLRFEDGIVGFEVPARQARALRAWRAGGAEGAEVVFGLRPEDFREAASAADGSGDGSPEAAFEIEGIEPLGAETMMHLKGAGGTIVARLGPDASGAIGERKRLALGLSKAHFFDPATEERIVPEDEGA